MNQPSIHLETSGELVSYPDIVGQRPSASRRTMSSDRRSGPERRGLVDLHNGGSRRSAVSMTVETVRERRHDEEMGSRRERDEDVVCPEKTFGTVGIIGAHDEEDVCECGRRRKRRPWDDG